MYFHVYLLIIMKSPMQESVLHTNDSCFLIGHYHQCHPNFYGSINQRAVVVFSNFLTITICFNFPHKALFNTTVAMIYKALHYYLLFLVECNILVTIPSLLFTIMMRFLHFSFWFCGLSSHVVRAKKSHMDIEEHNWTLHTFLFFSYTWASVSMKICEKIWYTKALSILNISHCQLAYALSRQS